MKALMFAAPALALALVGCDKGTTKTDTGSQPRATPAAGQVTPSDSQQRSTTASPQRSTNGATGAGNTGTQAPGAAGGAGATPAPAPAPAGGGGQTGGGM